MHTTTQEATTMHVDTSTRVGRMLAGLIASTNRRARVTLTVDVEGVRTYHQPFRVKGWENKAGQRMLTFDLDDGDWGAGTYATRVLHVNTITGEVAAARGYNDQLVLYMARAALQYACTGTPPQPSNGSVRVQESLHCGSCGQRLTHPVSIELGIGPECARRAGLAHHYGGSAVAATRTPPAPAPAQEDADTATAAWVAANAVVLDSMGAPSRTAAVAAALAAHERGEQAPHLDIFGAPVLAPTPGTGDYARLTVAAIAEADARMAQLRADIARASSSHDWERAQQLEDVYDSVRGARSGMAAELQAARQ